MLPKRRRIAKTKEIETLFQKGVGSFGRLSGVKALAAGNNNPSRFVIVVSTKVSKKAVVRNLIKRRTHAIVQRYLSKVRPGYHVFILLLPAAAQAQFADLEKDVINNFRRLKLV